ncbi:MAG: RDD family protein [Deltaproteobacteria bacterium]|nr:RDD family protein [Deltaproteobacteria bacterium]
MDEDLTPQHSEASPAPPIEAVFARPGFLERLIAKFIDLLVVGAFFAFPSFIGVLAGATYILISDGLYDGRSIGKKIIGLKVVLDGASPCDFRRSIIRNAEFALVILVYVVIGWIPYAGKPIAALLALAVAVVEIALMVTDDGAGARFGDRIAGTGVVAAKTA